MLQCGIQYSLRRYYLFSFQRTKKSVQILLFPNICLLQSFLQSPSFNTCFIYEDVLFAIQLQQGLFLWTCSGPFPKLKQVKLHAILTHLPIDQCYEISEKLVLVSAYLTIGVKLSHTPIYCMIFILYGDPIVISSIQPCQSIYQCKSAVVALLSPY